ncbi:MAG: stage II sporulation protein R, partial [Ruminococcus sp.]|nr:stage II sporulation protein R [Ruminococcus sp.]
MRLWIKSACVAFVLTVLYSLIPFQAACTDISGEVFRLHILANSDSEADQALKLKVRDRILSEMQPLLSAAPDKQTAEAVVSGNLQHFADIACDEVMQNGCDYPVTAEITNMYFNT